jgi:hypothetical protein
MRPPSTSELLAAWECGLRQPPLERTRTLLRLAVPEEADLSGLSAGQVDGYLLDLRRCGFGSRVVGAAGCPGCAEQVELDFDIETVLMPMSPPPSPPPAAAMTAELDGYRLRLRLPTLDDLLATAHLRDVTLICQAVLERTVVATLGDRTVAPAALPLHVVEFIEARFAESDPQADLRLALTCPTCGREWAAPFDIATFLWAELDAWAVRVLFEVHLLASAYCWSEADVLALSATRRRFYLEAVGG